MSVKKIISLRKTCKILSRNPLSGNIDEATLQDLITAAGQAPFHYSTDSAHRNRLEDHAPEPWRIYILHREICLEIRDWLQANNEKSKVPDMLASASILLQITWCPNPPPETIEMGPDCIFHASQINMEHIAATAAAVQNILLLATEKNILSYWSSGGPLRTSQAFKLLGIPPNEILIGSVFLYPASLEKQQEVQIIPGKLRNRRSINHSWCKTVTSLDFDLPDT